MKRLIDSITAVSYVFGPLEQVVLPAAHENGVITVQGTATKVDQTSCLPEGSLSGPCGDGAFTIGS